MSSQEIYVKAQEPAKIDTGNNGHGRNDRRLFAEAQIDIVNS